ncbi:MAG: methyltransferase domain-containing protein, partial [Clostridiales bacterium]|nr:methyltransferase domain-containing protein [Clostridiales bacterium]
HNGIKLTTTDLFDPETDLKIDITDISLPDSSYDMVICNHVLEHVSSYEKALSELNRILKPGGKLIISFPIDPSLDSVLEKEAPTPEDRVRIFGQNDHVRLFGKDSRELIGNYGFNVTVIDTGVMPESILPVTGPADYDSDQIFYCEKIN